MLVKGEKREEKSKTMTRSDLLSSPKISGYTSKRICVKTMCSENSSKLQICSAIGARMLIRFLYVSLQMSS